MSDDDGDITPEDCPEDGWEGRWQWEHEIKLAMTADLEGGMLPSFLLAKYGPAMGWVPAADVEREKAAHKRTQTLLAESESARQRQAAAVNSEREKVPWDHLESATQRRLMADAQKWATAQLPHNQQRRRNGWARGWASAVRALGGAGVTRVGVLPVPRRRDS
jgi:hypothetical protein